MSGLADQNTPQRRAEFLYRVALAESNPSYRQLAAALAQIARMRPDKGAKLERAVEIAQAALEDRKPAAPARLGVPESRTGGKR